MHHILLVDDEKSMLEFLEYMLKKMNMNVTVASRAREALQVFRQNTPVDLVISDLRMPGMDGLELLKKSRELDSEVPFIFITAYASSETAIEALKLGAYDYITKPFQVEELKNLVRKALETSDLKRKVKVYESELKKADSREDESDSYRLVGVSPPMLEIYKLIGTIAETDSTVLLTGESGTGKELIARAIHVASPRRTGPFVSVNCGALAETLLESELFGYVKGAFTGAVADKMGLFETAEKGILLLDEIGEMSPAMQVKLLRTLQDKTVRPVGGVREIAVDVRLIAATNRILEREIEAGNFREDLYYRLAVIPIEIPPLRDRVTDVLNLVNFFIRRYNLRLKRSVQGISEEALSCLEEYAWPGNVRELENVIERAVALETSEYIQKERLPGRVRHAQTSAGVHLPWFSKQEGFDLQAHVEEVERAVVNRALEICGGNQKAAAAVLKMTYRSFRHRMERLKLRPQSQG